MRINSSPFRYLLLEDRQQLAVLKRTRLRPRFSVLDGVFGEGEDPPSLVFPNRPDHSAQNRMF